MWLQKVKADKLALRSLTFWYKNSKWIKSSFMLACEADDRQISFLIVCSSCKDWWKSPNGKLGNGVKVMGIPRLEIHFSLMDDAILRQLHLREMCWRCTGFHADLVKNVLPRGRISQSGYEELLWWGSDVYQRAFMQMEETYVIMVGVVRSTQRLSSVERIGSAQRRQGVVWCGTPVLSSCEEHASLNCY